MAAPVALTGAGNVTAVTGNPVGSLTGTKPANTANGDLLWAAFYHRNNTRVFDPPDGWTEVKAEPGNGSTGFFVKPVPTASAEPATYVFTTTTPTNTARCILLIGRITGANLSNPVDAVGASSAFTGTSSLVHPQLTASADEALLLTVSTNNTSGATVSTFTAAATMTQVAQQSVTTGAATSNMQIARETLAAPGATGTRTATISPAAANSAGFMVAIRAPVLASATLTTASALSSAARVVAKAATTLTGGTALLAEGASPLPEGAAAFAAGTSLAATSQQTHIAGLNLHAGTVLSPTPAWGQLNFLVEGQWQPISMSQLVAGEWVED